MNLVKRIGKKVKALTFTCKYFLLDFAWATRTTWFVNSAHPYNMRHEVYFGFERTWHRPTKRYGYSLTVGKLKITFIKVNQ